MKVSISRRRVSAGLVGCGLMPLSGGVALGQAADTRAGATPGSGVATRNARDVRNGWGVNVPNTPDAAASTAEALRFIGTRWARLQFDGDTSPSVAALQAELVQRGGPEPNLRLQLLLNGYLDGAAENTWSSQGRWLLDRILPIRRTDGRPVLAAIEGPNEVNSGNGGGSRGPDDAIDRTGGQVSTSDNPTANRNFVEWARRLSEFRRRHAEALRGVEILSPTILYFFPHAWSRDLDVSPHVDFGTFHYYAGVAGTAAVPSWPANPDNFARMYGFAQAGICPGKPLVQSEGGVSSQSEGGYAGDGRSGARYHLMQLFDHHAVGGHRYMIYDLFNAPGSVRGRVTTDPEDNFGLYYGDRATPKPAALALHNVANLLSLGNRHADLRNARDEAPFAPTYDGRGLAVSGLRDAGSAGHALVMPKSDGSTVIAVWNEPLIDTGSGASVTPAANPVRVDLGSAHSWRLYDPTGGDGVPDFTARVATTPIDRGTGRLLDVTLHGTPLLIELTGQDA